MTLSWHFVSVLALLALPAISNADDCKCVADVTKSGPGSATISGPTQNGVIGANGCAATCNTTVTFTGTNPANNFQFGLNITVSFTTGLDSLNYFVINGGAISQTINTNVNAPIVVPMPGSNTVTFQFKFSSAATTVIQIKTMTGSAPTTTAPAPPTTPPYIPSDGFPFSPKTMRVDLTILTDLSGDISDAAFANAKDAILKIAAYPSYTSDFTRLTLMTADPYGIQTFAGQPWSHNNATVQSTVEAMLRFNKGSSRYEDTLKAFFNSIESGPDFVFRENTERVLLILTPVDSASLSPTDLTFLQEKIDTYDLKIIFMSTDPNKAPSPANFPNVVQLQGTNPSNKQVATNYGSKFEASAFYTNYLFNGNALCNRPTNPDVPVVPGLTYQIPVAGAHMYCTYMNNLQGYNTDPTKTYKLTFVFYNTVANKDLITIAADGTTVDVISGLYGTQDSYCIPNPNKISVSFVSKEGVVSSGFTYTLKAFDTPTACVTAATPSKGNFMRAFRV